MNDNARITVIGELADMTDTQENSNEPSTDIVEFMTTGKWFTKNGKEHIIYEDHQLIEGQVTKTRVTIDDTMVTIRRSGASNNHLVFDKGVSHQLPYETPFGVLQLTSTTDEIFIDLSTDRIELKVIYRLEVDHTDMGTNTFHIIGQRILDESL